MQWVERWRPVRLRNWSTSRFSCLDDLNSTQELFGCHFAFYDSVDAGFPARHSLAGFFVGDIDVEDDDEMFGADEGAVDCHGVDFVGVLPPFAFGEDCGFAFGEAWHRAVGHGFEAGGVVGVEG